MKLINLIIIKETVNRCRKGCIILLPGLPLAAGASAGNPSYTYELFSLQALLLASCPFPHEIIAPD